MKYAFFIVLLFNIKYLFIIWQNGYDQEQTHI